MSDDALDRDTIVHLRALLKRLSEADPADLEQVRDLMDGAISTWRRSGGAWNSPVQQILLCYRQLASMRARELRRGERMVADFERYLEEWPPDDVPPPDD